MNFQPVIEEFLNKIKSLEVQNKELLEALEEAEAWFHDVRGYYVPEVGFDAVCEKIKETIKKATGE